MFCIRQTGCPLFDSNDPLNPNNIPLLLFAEHFVFHNYDPLTPSFHDITRALAWLASSPLNPHVNVNPHASTRQGAGISYNPQTLTRDVMSLARLSIAAYSVPLSIATYSCEPPIMDVSLLTLLSEKPITHTLGPMTTRVKLFPNWHLKSTGQVCQGRDVCSSVIVNIQRNVITTTSGSIYILIGLDTQINQVMHLLSSVMICPLFDPSDPLQFHIVPLLLFAERIVFGDLSSRMDSIIKGLKVLAEQVQRNNTRDANTFSYHDDAVIQQAILMSK